MNSFKRIFLRFFSAILVIAMIASLASCDSVIIEDDDNNDGVKQDATDIVETHK